MGRRNPGILLNAHHLTSLLQQGEGSFNPEKILIMIGKIIKQIRAFTLISNLAKEEPNDYSFGYKVRRIIDSYREKKEISKDILKEKPKP